MRKSEEAMSRERQMRKATYDYCKRQGICVKCRKEPAFNGQVRCPSCIERDYLRQAERNANRTQEQRDKANAAKRAKYHRYKDEGRCVNCGRPAVEGITLCTRCRIQSNRSSYERNIRSGRKKGWAECGLCIRCGAEPIEGKKLCPECLEKNRASMAYARQFAPTDRFWERY